MPSPLNAVLGTAGAAAAAAVVYKTDNPISRPMVNYWDKALDWMQGSKEHCKNNPFTQGPWKPSAEHVAEPMVVVSGTMPAELGGAFLRIGPNPSLGSPANKRYHPFDGDGMLHVVRFKDGKALYSNAMMQTNRVKIEQERQEEYFTRVLGEFTGGIGLLKAITVAGRKEKIYNLSAWDSGTANTNTLYFDGDVFALQESTFPYEVELADNGAITSLGYSNFGGLLDYGVSAHPRVDMRTDQLIFHGYTIAPMPDTAPYKLGIRSKGSPSLDVYTPIGLNRPSFNHDLCFTENYVVILDQNVAFDFAKIIEGSMLSWDKKHRLRIGLQPRTAKSDKVMWFEADKGIGIVHAFSAYEENGEVVLWAPASTDFVSGSTFSLEEQPFQEPTKFRITEFRMDLKDEQRGITISTIEGDYTSPEFSGINPEFNGYPARFGYCCDQEFDPQGTMRKVGGTGFNFTSLMKIDFKERRIAKRVALQKGCVAGDPAFCPRPGATEEDDGWLCVVVKNVDKETTELHLYDGATLDLAVALGFTVHIPLGFHSNYISEAQVQEHLQKHAARSRL